MEEKTKCTLIKQAVVHYINTSSFKRVFIGLSTSEFMWSAKQNASSVRKQNISCYQATFISDFQENFQQKVFTQPRLHAIELHV